MGKARRHGLRKFQLLQRAARGVLFGELFCAPHAAGQRLSALAGRAFHAHLDEKTLWWSGPLSLLDAVIRERRHAPPAAAPATPICSCPARLQSAVRGPVARQLRPSPGCAQKPAPAPGRHRDRARPSLLPWYWRAPCSSAQAAAIFAAAQAQMLAQADRSPPPAPCAGGLPGRNGCASTRPRAIPDVRHRAPRPPPGPAPRRQDIPGARCSPFRQPGCSPQPRCRRPQPGYCHRSAPTRAQGSDA